MIFISCCRLTIILSCLIPWSTNSKDIEANKYRRLFSVVEDATYGETTSLETDLLVDTGSYGIMFDIMPFKELVIVDISFYTDVTFEVNFELYLKEGTYFPSKDKKDDWTLMASGSKKGEGKGKLTSSSGFKPIKLDANKVVGVYLTLDSYDMRHSTTDLNMGDVAESNGDLMIEVGSGVEKYPLGDKFTQPRLFRGAITYYDPNVESSVVVTNPPTLLPTELTIAPTPPPTEAPTPPNTPKPSIVTDAPTEMETDSTDQSSSNKIVEGCTKQLMYLQGDDLGLVTADNILTIQKIVKSELNKLFSKNVDRAQILEVTVADQLFDPEVPRDITIVTLILGSFPNDPNFVFDTEVQKMFDVIAPTVLSQLKKNIYRYGGVTDLFSVIDWHLNTSEVNCGKMIQNEMSTQSVEEPKDETKRGLSTASIILITFAVFFLVICIPGSVLLHRARKKNETGEPLTPLEEYTDDTIARLAELYAKSAYSTWSDDGQGK